MAVNRLGFSYKEVGRLYFGKYIDLFSVHKFVHNFETKKMLYNIEQPQEEKEVARLSEL